MGKAFERAGFGQETPGTTLAYPLALRERWIPQNVEYATSALAPPGSRTLSLTSSAGIEVGDYLRGSLSVPAEAVVRSVSKNTVTLSRPTTGSIEKGLRLGFISPGSKGSQNAAFVMLKNDSSVKASNAIMSLAWCTKADTYCSGGNDIALYDGPGAIKLVGREIDVDFGVRGGRSNGHSAGLFINSFNGSGYQGSGNGPAIQIGAVSGYWTVGFECNGIRASGACLSMGGHNAPIDAFVNVTQGKFASGAIILGVDDGANGQLIRFNGPTGEVAATMSINDRSSLTIRNVVGVTDIIGPLSATSVSASGFKAGGVPGITAIKTVRNAAGTGTCTFEFTQGLYTGGTC